MLAKRRRRGCLAGRCMWSQVASRVVPRPKGQLAMLPPLSRSQRQPKSARRQATAAGVEKVYLFVPEDMSIMTTCGGPYSSA